MSGLRSVLSLHRQAGPTVLVLVVTRVALLLLDDPAGLALLDPRSASLRARAGVLALLGLVALAGTSVWRRRPQTPNHASCISSVVRSFAASRSSCGPVFGSS